MFDVEREVADLHAFFVGWFSGSVPNTDEAYAAGFLSWCDPAFVLITPAGTAVPMEALTTALRGGHGSNPAFRIAVSNVNVRWQTPDLVVATYEEWQRNATATTPANNGRISTAVFRPTSDARNGLVWLHVQETWLPADVIAAGDYEF